MSAPCIALAVPLPYLRVGSALLRRHSPLARNAGEGPGVSAMGDRHECRSTIRPTHLLP